MKKLFAIVLSLVLCLGAVSAMAEGTAVNWTDVAGSVEEVPADFVKLDATGLQMWMPTVFVPVEVPEEQKAQGLLYAFSTEDGSAQIGVSLFTMEEEKGLTDFMAALEAAGATGIEYVTLNDLPAASCALQDAVLVCVEPYAGYVAQFTFGPASNTDFAQTAQAMSASIQIIPAE